MIFLFPVKVIFLVSSELLKCRSLKCLLAHPMIHFTTRANHHFGNSRSYCFVSREHLKGRLLKCLSAHPTIHVRFAASTTTTTTIIIHIRRASSPPRAPLSRSRQARHLESGGCHMTPRRDSTANLRTKIPDFGGFESRIILILRGGIPRPMRNFL